MRKFLIFAQRTDIRKISLDVDYFTDVSLPIRSLRNAIALGVDIVKSKFYLLHPGPEVIKLFFTLNSTEHKTSTANKINNTDK